MKNIVVRQEDEADCGACCLLSVIKYYNGFIPLEYVKVDTLTTKEGTTFYNLKVTAEKYGFEVSGKKEFDLSKIKLPAIAQIKINNFYHFVVIVKIDKDTIILMDPAIGKNKLKLSKFNEMFTGYILELFPISNIVNIKVQSLFLKLLKNVILQNKCLFIKIFVLTLVICLLLIVSTLLVNSIFSLSSFNLIILIILILSKIVINYLKNVYVFKLNKSLNESLSADYIRKIFFLPFKYLCLRKEGDLVSRFDDINVIKENISVTIVESLVNFLIIVSTSIMLYILNKRIFMIVIIITLFVLLIVYFHNKKMYQDLERTIDSNTSLTDTVISFISNIWTVKIITDIRYYFNKIKDVIIDNSNQNYSLNKKIALNELLISSYTELVLILIIVFNVYLKLNMGSLLSFIFINNYFISGVSYFCTMMPNIMFFKSAYRRINSIYYLEDENYKGVSFKNGNILIKNLTYSIGLNNVFNNFSLNINMGDNILIKGSNGSGKSSLLNMFYGIIDDYEGSISVGGIPIKDFSLKSLRSHISYVNQNQKLIPGTLLENIILGGKLEEDKLKIIEKMLNLDRIYQTKYNGLNSVIRDNFSGGEVQKIILARALYKDFDILLLDEALSQIDISERRKILQNICDYYKKKTIIMVSHNKEYYKFDKIIFLNNRKEKVYVK